MPYLPSTWSAHTRHPSTLDKGIDSYKGQQTILIPVRQMPFCMLLSLARGMQIPIRVIS